MAAPAYTEDLTDIDLAESGSTGWTAFNISGGGGGVPAFGADFGMQGAGCWDKAASNAERAAAVNKTPGTGTTGTGVHIYQWGFVATPGICDVYATRGVYVLIGTSTTNFMQFTVEGSDTIGAGGRVGKCYPIRYVTTSNPSSVPYRTVNGTPGATPTYFGYGIKTTATAKGSNFGADAVRYGTGAYLTAGELISAGDASDAPCTFTGFATQNDSSSNRWGILSFINGSFELQGTFAIGQNNAGTATLARFKASDQNILVNDTVHSESTFSKFIIDHGSTRCEWTNISITALGTNNRGSILVNNATTDFIVIGGVWTGLSTIDLEAAADLTGVTMRSTDLITLNGGALDLCTIDNSRNAISVSASTLDNMTGCEFISDGSNHAVELDSIGGGSMSWDNDLTGYVTGAAGSPVTPTSTGNEAIYVNVATASDLTINVVAGATIPSIRVGGSFTGDVNVVAGTVTTSVTAKDADTGALLENARVLAWVTSGVNFPYQSSVTISAFGTTATVTHTAHGLATNDNVLIEGADDENYNGAYQITVTGPNNYTYTTAESGTSPGGTITATFCFLNGDTNASGYISDTRTVSVNQPINYRARKSTTSPLYRQSAGSTTVNKDTGIDITANLVSDE